MQSRHSNEDAVAYGWYMLLAFLVLGALSYFCVTAIYNEVIDVANEDIIAGHTSEATKAALSFNRDIALYIPVIMLIGCFVWAMVRGIGGSGATYQTFYYGYIILFLCCFVSFMMAFTGGMLIDRLYSELDSQGYIQGSEISADWAAVQGETIYGFMNMYYGLCYIVPFLGGAVFFQSIAKRTSGSQYLRA